ncbi:MAG: creatininase family protein [Armatimonadota bacterium]
MLDWQATWCDLEEPPWLAILPLGSIEQHGPHLPIGTDWLVGGYIAKEVARELEAWLLPAQPFSCAQEHQDFPGTISLRPVTLGILLADIVDSVGRAGIQRLAILNYHGGNWALKAISRDLNRQQDAVVVYALNCYEGVSGLAMEEDLHAGDFETSQILHLRPDLVRDVQCDFIPGVPAARLDQVGMRDISPDGNWGCPSQATAERGARDLAWMVKETVRRIQEAYDYLDTLGT